MPEEQKRLDECEICGATGWNNFLLIKVGSYEASFDIKVAAEDALTCTHREFLGQFARYHIECCECNHSRPWKGKVLASSEPTPPL